MTQFRPKPPRALPSPPDLDQQMVSLLLKQATTICLNVLAYFGARLAQPIVFESATHQVIIQDRPVVVMGADGRPKSVERTNGGAKSA